MSNFNTEEEMQKYREAERKYGRELGRREGRAEGLAKGIAEGCAIVYKKSFPELMDYGMSCEDIAKFFEISEAEVQNYIK
jgi:predicted transposase YdaD